MNGEVYYLKEKRKKRFSQKERQKTDGGRKSGSGLKRRRSYVRENSFGRELTRSLPAK